MTFEETLKINSSLDKVWKIFTDITCWAEWNTVLKNVNPRGKNGLLEGESFDCCINPFNFPINLKPKIEKIIENKEVTWSGKRFGIQASHKFYFSENNNQVVIKSIESFSGSIIQMLCLIFPRKRLRDLNITFLNDLKRKAET